MADRAWEEQFELDIRGAFYGDLKALKQHVNMAELIGEYPRATYEQVAAHLEEYVFPLMLRELRALEGHQHVWGEQDLCEICGMDGRA